MTADEAISITRLARKVDDMADEMVTKELLKAELMVIETSLAAHVEYSKMADAAETSRLNAIHDADAKALSVANAEANDKAATLATNVDKVAIEARALVETTRSAYSKSQSELINPIIEKIQIIEKKQYEDKGAARYTDPLITELVKKMDAMVISLSENKGKGMGANSLWLLIIGGIGLISVIINIIHAIGG